MTEAQLLAEILRMCEKRGLAWHHCRDSRACSGPKGFPDLLILGPHGLLLAELKSDDGETTAGQDWWLWQMATSRAPLSGGLWRPADLASGHIRQELEKIT